MPAKILIIDDEPKMTQILKRVLGREGYDVDITHDPEKAVGYLRETKYDVILSDLKMPKMSGMEILKHAITLQKDADFIMMTAYATVQSAVEAMKLGAFDYLIKPFSMDDLKQLLKRLLESREIVEEGGEKKVSEKKTPAGFDHVIAESSTMKQLIKKAHKVAASDVSVLLTGESGTGKEIIARAMHSSSPRSDMPLVIVNCGAIPENLLESEFFGHRKGAFTGAVESREGLFKSANGGTVFLDEVGELPQSLQVKLLRVLQEGEFLPVGEVRPAKVDVRILAATNKDLEAAIKEGTFRQDLFYRLNVIPIHIPPLRERPDDILSLIDHFLSRFEAAGRHIRISTDAEELLVSHPWPGNVRELENAVEHAAVMCEDDTITKDDLPPGVLKEAETGEAADVSSLLDHLTLEDMEKRSIIAALKKTGGNQTRAADLLGITRRTLGYRMKKYNIESD